MSDANMISFVWDGPMVDGADKVQTDRQLQEVASQVGVPFVKGDFISEPNSPRAMTRVLYPGCRYLYVSDKQGD